MNGLSHLRDRFRVPLSQALRDSSISGPVAPAGHGVSLGSPARKAAITCRPIGRRSGGGTAFDPDVIADHCWRLHTPPRHRWQREILHSGHNATDGVLDAARTER
ncbi:hypothetical protein GCM10015536_34880 [Streptomyces griseomycini]|nr:hypothetical protein GCM10015536_34880 [Streptomyces griseomycini]